MSLLICSLVIFMVMGVPIAYSMGASGLLYFLVHQPALISVLPARVFAGMDSSVMISLPLFIIMGHLMNHGGLTSRLIDFCMILEKAVSRQITGKLPPVEMEGQRLRARI